MQQIEIECSITGHNFIFDDEDGEYVYWKCSDCNEKRKQLKDEEN